MGQAWAVRGNHGDVVEYLGAGMGHLRVFKGQAGALRGIKGLPPPVDIYILVLGLVARENCTILKFWGWATI